MELTSLAPEFDEQDREAAIRAWRVDRDLRELPDIAHHVRSLQVGVVTKRDGEPRTVAPMDVLAVDALDEVYVQLAQWVQFWADTLQTAPPTRDVDAWRSFDFSHRSAGHRDATVLGMKPGLRPAAARSMVAILTLWLHVKADRIEQHTDAATYQDDLIRIVREIRGAYPTAPRPERPVIGRECPTCGEPAIHAEWVDGDASRVRVTCEACWYEYPPEQITPILRTLVKDGLIEEGP